MQPQLPERRVRILGCPVDCLSTGEILEWIAAAVERREPRLVAVVNANKHFLMARHPRLKSIVTSADLVVPEWAVVWAARRLGIQGVPHSGGVIIAKEFPPVAVQRGIRPYFLGATPEVVDRLVNKLRTDHPGLRIAGAHHGYLTSPAIEEEALSDIERTRPDVLFVAFGSPAQEYWIAAHRERLRVPVSIGVGGTFDVLSGAKSDAPDWARGNGLEWIYRTAQNPRAYWKRYMRVNTWFVWQVMKARVRGQHADTL